MRKYGHQSKLTTRPLVNTTKALRQAPLSDILQIYNNSMVERQPTQGEPIKEKESIKMKEPAWANIHFQKS